ncbi:MAG: hypothetical protein KatS3mg054_0126 [Chloroflexus sp.]|nr:MAG: hypothetical protein KatS3mg054_0126 [Chloroflexus sp.]
MGVEVGVGVEVNVLVRVGVLVKVGVGVGGTTHGATPLVHLGSRPEVVPAVILEPDTYTLAPPSRAASNLDDGYEYPHGPFPLFHCDEMSVDDKAVP